MAGRLWSWDALASDADGDALSYSLVSGPSGMSIHPRSGHLAWLPQADQLGKHLITVRATDTAGAASDISFDLFVRRLSGAPTIVSVPITEAVVGQTLLTTIKAIDPESDPLTFELLSGPLGMTVDSASGDLSWTPAANQIGESAVFVQVRDGFGNSATQGFSVRTSVGSSNHPPQIVSVPKYFASVGQTYSLKVDATDGDGNPLTFGLRRNPSGMTIDPQSGLISWIPSSAQVGRVDVSITASDGVGGTAVQSFQIDVRGVNHAPQILSTPVTQVAAGAVYKMDVVVVDSDRDPITFTLAGNVPPGMTIDSLGRLRWPTQTSDSRGGVTQQRVDLQVVPDTKAPRVTVLPTPGGWPWDGPVIVYVSAVDNVGVTDLELKVNGRNVPLDANNMARLTYDDFGPGLLDMIATARDAAGNVGTGTAASAYRNPDVDYETNPDLPTALVASPVDSETVTGFADRRAGTGSKNIGCPMLEPISWCLSNSREVHRKSPMAC
jgi:hypothetical protein